MKHKEAAVQPAPLGPVQRMVRRLVQTTEDRYESIDGFVMQREDGLTPNGNPIAGRWVLRNGAGVWIGHDQYRHDLAALHGFDVRGVRDDG